MTEKIADLLYAEIGKRIKERREERQVTQEALSASIDISRASISNIELGRQQTPISVLYAIAEHLGGEIMDLLPSMSELLIIASREVDGLESLLNSRNDFGDDTKQKISEIIRRPTNEI